MGNEEIKNILRNMYNFGRLYQRIETELKQDHETLINAQIERFMHQLSHDDQGESNG